MTRIASFKFPSCGAPIAKGWPTGQWTVTSYNDQTGNTKQATQGICIVGDGTWYGTTYADWGGDWFKKGNDLHMNGNFWDGAGNDIFEFDKVAGWHMDGYWQEWTDDFTTEFWFTAKWQKKSNTCAPPAAQVSDPGMAPASANTVSDEE